MMSRLGIFAIILLAFTLTTSCEGQRKFREARAATQEKERVRKAEYAAKLEAEKEAKELAASGVSEAAPVDTPVLINDSTLFQFDRRPCFGRCPIYKIRVYESGYTTYEGINFVPYMGYYQTKLTPTDLAKIYAYIAEANFFELDDVYDNEHVTDLPGMVFRANAMGNDKRIIARYDIPDELKDLAKKIDLLFAETDWQPVHQ